jgi:hypothetical protein
MSLRSRLEALHGSMSGRIKEAFLTGVQKTLAVVKSHYGNFDAGPVSEGFLEAEDAELLALEDSMKGARRSAGGPLPSRGRAPSPEPAVKKKRAVVPL